MPGNEPSSLFQASSVASNENRRLLVINYAMNSNNSVFAHQIDVVRKLANFYSAIHVITNEYEGEPLPSNVKVNTVPWKNNEDLRNTIRFYKVFTKVFFQSRPHVIFSHMTEIQSALIAPFLKLIARPHYLWYAHTSPSVALKATHLFATGIVTSTPGSCPVRSQKVFPIGQAIDEKLFYLSRRAIRKSNMRAIHVGRLDPSKKILELIRTVSEGHFERYFESLTLIGNTTTGYETYHDQILSLINSYNGKSSISVLGAVQRIDLHTYLESHDVFLHAFIGSLDKSLVEATMSGIPVITANPEYLINIGSWSPVGIVGATTLEKELEHFLATDSKDIEKEIQRRHEIVHREHGLDSWVIKLLRILERDFR